MSDYKSHSSTAQDDNITEDMAPEPIEEHTNPKKKNILIRIYQNPRSKIFLAVFALLMLGVGAVAVQKVQNYKSKADYNPYQTQCSRYCHRVHRCDPDCSPPRAPDGSCYAEAGCDECISDCGRGQQVRSVTGFTSQEQRIAYEAFLRSIGQSDTAANRARYTAQAAEEARIRAEWQRAYAYATELKKQQEYRDAAAYARACQAAQSIKPTLTWRSGRDEGDMVLPGERQIKFQVGAGQDGAIIFIDDKANPWSGSCNNLKRGDKCLVPDGKGFNKHADGTRITKEQVGAAGKTQTTYSGFEDGHSYRVWLKGASCGKLSPDSNKLDITVAANDLSGTPAVSTTPAVSPTGTNTQQQGHL